MKKREPKMILNIAFENDELEKKIQIAMDKYVGNLVNKNLDDYIEKIIVKRIEEITCSNNRYSYYKINGKTLDELIKSKTDSIISDVIEKNIKNIFAKKVAELL